MTDQDVGLSLEQSAFETLQRDFSQVLENLVGEKGLDKFRSEYEKLLNALKKSHDNEKRLVKKVKELNHEIVTNAQKVATALKLSEDDDQTIDSLKKQIEKAWLMVEASHKKELKANETIQMLKEEVANLTKLVKKHSGLMGQDSTVDDLLKVRDNLRRKQEESQQKIDQLHEREQQLLDRVEHKRQKGRQKKVIITEMKEQLMAQQKELEREQRIKRNGDSQIDELKRRIEDKQKMIDTLQHNLKEGDIENKNIRRKLQEVNRKMEKTANDFSLLYQNTKHLTEQLDEHMSTNERLVSEKGELETNLKKARDEARKLESEVAQLKRQRDNEKKRSQRIQDKLNEEKLAQKELRNEINSLNISLGKESKRYESSQKEVAQIDRARTVELQKRMKESERANENETKYESSERAIQHLENKIAEYRSEAVKARNIILMLEREREKFGIQAAEANTNLKKAREEVKLKEAQIAEIEKKEAEVKSRLKHQRQMYEAVRADRNTYSKHLIEAQDEIAELKRKMKIMSHQIEQLKEEVTAKDRALVAEHFDHASVGKKLEQKEKEVAELKSMLSEADAALRKQDIQISKLNNTIRRMDEDLMQQKKEYDQVMTERDILGTQLIRRNDELALLYEKVKIQDSTLRKGEAQYQQRLDDIRMLKLKIADLRRSLQIVTSQAGQLSDLKREVRRLQKELLEEKTKVKALSEELENPMNVHRWRKLEGSDPATFEMIQKIQTLQKRLIAKTEEVVEKDLMIQEKNKLYEELKNILARQPGPEVAEQLSLLQQNLREKTRQMKAMASELNMYQAQVNEYKYEIERLSRELHSVKKKYYEQKKKLQTATDKLSTAVGEGGTGGTRGVPQSAVRQAAAQAAAAQNATARFVGGGFNIQP